MSVAAEALLAVSGIDRKKPLDPSEGARAVELPARWRRKARSFLNGTAAEFKPPVEVDVLKKWARLIDPPSDEERAALLVDLENAQVAAEYQATLSNAYEFLRGVWPVASVQGALKPRLLPASTMETWQASSMWQIADDPEVILSRMMDRTLTDADVQVFRGVYPELAKMLEMLLSEELTDIEGARPSFEPSWEVDQVLRLFLGLPFDVQMAEVSRPPPKMTSSQGLGNAIKFKDEETKAQRLASK